MSPTPVTQIQPSDLVAVDLRVRVGRIVAAEPLLGAPTPAYRLVIDLGAVLGADGVPVCGPRAATPRPT